MKKLLVMAMAVIAFASCSKNENINEVIEPKDGSQVEISFHDESATKAFFDSNATAEAWEKSLNSVTILAFNQSGAILVQREFTSSELTAKTASFALPNTVAGDNCEFYAVANMSVGTIATKTALLALLENSTATYNGTFAEVSSAAKRSGGFVMSGNVSKAMSSAGTTTSVAITLKRTVAKVAIEATQSADFTSKYKGAIKVNSAKLLKSASQTPIVKPTTANSGVMTFTHTQTSNTVSNKYQNLFYIFENGALTAGNRVAVELSATYDVDGNFTTTADQTPMTYIAEIEGTGGAIVRNGYYRLQVSISGLSGNEASVSVTVADWEAPTTQNVSLGN